MVYLMASTRPIWLKALRPNNRGTAVGGAYNIGRAGAALAPVAIGFFASQISIGFGFLVMGGAYFICGVIPALFIREKQFDPEKQ